MTNLEYIRTLTAEQLHDFLFKTTDLMCLQHGKYSKEIWQIRCLNEYKGSVYEMGCRKCRIDWLNSEVGATEERLKHLAIQRGETHT